MPTSLRFIQKTSQPEIWWCAIFMLSYGQLQSLVSATALSPVIITVLRSSYTREGGHHPESIDAIDCPQHERITMITLQKLPVQYFA